MPRSSGGGGAAELHDGTPGAQAWERRYNFERFAVALKGETPARRREREASQAAPEGPPEYISAKTLGFPGSATGGLWDPRRSTGVPVAVTAPSSPLPFSTWAQRTEVQGAAESICDAALRTTMG
jgi:hypothetical protein